MEAPEYRPIAEAEAPGIKAQVRISPRATSETMKFMSPVDILTFRVPPAAKVWSRPDHSGNGEFVLDGPITFRPRFATWETRSNGAPQMTLVTKFERPIKYPVSLPRAPFSIYESGLVALMQMLLNEMREPGFSSAALVESIGNILRVKLRRYMYAGGAPEPKSAPLGNDKLGLLHEYIVAQKGRSPTVTELAELCQLSPRGLLRQFRARTGATVAAYITQVQLEKSKALLTASDLMVKQIASEVGFADANHFSTAFKRLTGITPLQFRETSRR